MMVEYQGLDDLRRIEKKSTPNFHVTIFFSWFIPRRYFRFVGQPVSSFLVTAESSHHIVE